MTHELRRILNWMANRQRQLSDQLASLKGAIPSLLVAGDPAILAYQSSITARLHEHREITQQLLPMGITASPRPYSKADSLHHDARASRFFADLENEGFDLQEFRHVLCNPRNLSPACMARLAEHIDADIGTLLSNGIGRGNSYDDLDQLVCGAGNGDSLGVVNHVA